MTNDNGHERVHVLRLSAKNIKSLREVAIDFEGEIHELRGDTGQGKTSVLESIEGAIRGLDPSMIRQGQDTAELELILTEAQVNRICHRHGKEELFVRDSDGNAIERGKEYLRAIFGPTTFQPVSWVRLSEGDARGRTERLRKQRDMLLESINMELTAEQVYAAVESLGEDHRDALAEVDLDNIDFTAHPFVVCRSLERVVYDHRQYVNKCAQDAENHLKLVPAPDTAPKASADELEAQVKSAEQAYWTAKSKADNRGTLRERRDKLAAQIEAEAPELPDADKLAKTREHYQSERDAAASEIERLEALLKEQRARKQDAEEKLSQAEQLARDLENHEARRADLAKLDAELAQETGGEDLEGLQRNLEDLRAKLASRNAQDAHDEAAENYRRARERSEVFTGLVKLFRDDLPQALLEAADLPIEGLGIDGDCVTVHGHPVHQLGTSEQLKVSVLIASYLNPKTGFILIDGAESLGKKDRAALAEAAHELGLQLIMSYVDESAEPGPGRTVMADGAAVGGLNVKRPANNWREGWTYGRRAE